MSISSIWRWATSSSPPGGRVAGALLLALLSASPAGAQAVTQEEALRLAFPGAQLERRTAYLDVKQLAAAQQLAGRDVEVKERVLSYYVAVRAGRPVGVAYFDVHRVRTKPEVVMVAVDAQGRVERVEILKFAEPPEYRAPRRWLDRLDGRVLAPDLQAGKAVPNLSGATLTASAVTRAVRRVLALHAIIQPLVSEK